MYQRKCSSQGIRVLQGERARLAVKPGASLIIVDFERTPGVSRDWTLDHVRAGKEVMGNEIEERGFEFVDELEISGLEEDY